MLFLWTLGKPGSASECIQIILVFLLFIIGCELTCLLSLVHGHALIVAKTIIRLCISLVISLGSLSLLYNRSAVVTVGLVSLLHFCAIHPLWTHSYNSWVMRAWLISWTHIKWKLSTASHIHWVCWFDVAHCGMVHLDGSGLSVWVGEVDEVFEKPLVVLRLVAYAAELLGIAAHRACFGWLLELRCCLLSCRASPDLVRVVVYALRTRRRQRCLLSRVLDGRVISSSISKCLCWLRLLCYFHLRRLQHIRIVRLPHRSSVEWQLAHLTIIGYLLRGLVIHFIFFLYFFFI